MLNKPSSTELYPQSPASIWKRREWSIEIDTAQRLKILRTAIGFGNIEVVGDFELKCQWWVLGQKTFKINVRLSRVKKSSKKFGL